MAGGTIVARGKPEDVLNTHTTTAQWIRGEKKPILRKSTKEPLSWLTIKGARANNLRVEVIRFPLRNLVGVCGVSGSGKSTLLIDTIGRALAPRKQTTSVAYEPLDPGEYDSIEGAPSRIIVIDQSRAGVHSPASFLGINKILRKLYAESDDAQILGIGEDQLTASCSACGGQGMITLDMTFLPNLHIPCETCHGTGYLPEAWEVRLNGISLPEVLSRTIEEVYQLFGDQNKLARPLRAARDVGLGYLVLRQAGYSLSGGEAQRLKIAQELSQKAPKDTLYILDEPTVGQHLEDVNRLVGVLYRLVDEGGSVIVIEHHTHMLAACDWLVELGPGGGPDGGYMIAHGTPAQVALKKTPIAPYLREVLEIRS